MLDHTSVEEDLFLQVLRMRIRQARKRLNLTQDDMAERTHMNLRHYQRFEAFKTQENFNPNLQQLRQVALALQVPLGTLFEETTPDEIQELKAHLESRKSRATDSPSG